MLLFPPKHLFGVFSNNCVVMIILIYAIFHSSFPFKFFFSSFAPFFLNCLWFEESGIVECTNSCLRQTQINVALCFFSVPLSSDLSTHNPANLHRKTLCFVKQVYPCLFTFPLPSVTGLFLSSLAAISFKCQLFTIATGLN